MMIILPEVFFMFHISKKFYIFNFLFIVIKNIFTQYCSVCYLLIIFPSSLKGLYLWVLNNEIYSSFSFKFWINMNKNLSKILNTRVNQAH